MVEYIFKVILFEERTNTFQYLHYLHEEETRWAHSDVNIIEVIPIDKFSSIYDEACLNSMRKKVIHKYEY